MIIGSMVKEFNIRRGEGLYFRVRFEYLIKKNFNIIIINIIFIVVNYVFINKLIIFYENSVYVVKWDIVRLDRLIVIVTV